MTRMRATTLLCRQPAKRIFHNWHSRQPRLTRSPAAEKPAYYENVVFAGGGNRCFWQAGFWSVAAPALRLEPARVSAVSAGSAIACALFSGSFDEGFVHYKKALAANASNFHLRNLLRDQPIFPHGDIYRTTILAGINERTLLRLHRGPEISVLVACPPRWASPGVAVLLGMIAGGIDEWSKEQVHASIGPRIGFAPWFISVRECATPAALADLIIASSCVPPLTPQARRNGISLLDGGGVSNVPTEGLADEKGATLVLLTRQFRALPSIPGRTYVQPSQPIPAAAWDYTDETAVQSTFDLGRRDGERFCKAIGR
jgi:predicted acylesterase/phospholipase RssA